MLKVGWTEVVVVGGARDGCRDNCTLIDGWMKGDTDGTCRSMELGWGLTAPSDAEKSKKRKNLRRGKQKYPAV